ncbi:MAG: GGDEF domain-containing protein [Acidobacteria bacterium]|nr:GGDEF domain-containing protein [Acidobacteriota bacterium]
MHLALGLSRLPRSARRQLASRAALRAWWRDLERPRSAEALGRMVVARLSEWLPLAGWAVVVPGAHSVELLSGPSQRRRLGAVALAIADAALHDQAHWSAGSVRAALGRGPDVAAVAWLLRGREDLSGMLVGIDSAPAPRPPAVAVAARALMADVLEPIGLALDRARQVDRLRQLAAIDDLTGLYNARHLTLTVERELTRLARTASPLSLVFLDLDGFKRVNDKHGHLLGSRALVEVGALLRACTRATDTAVRYGGDEFVVVLPETGRRDAAVVARRIQQHVAAETFLTGSGLAVRLTVSVGVATVARPTHTAADLIRTADEAMYWVKRHGSNDIRGVLLGRAAQRGSTSA